MNNTLLSTVAATGFTVAFIHAAIPTHWLPFVLVSRARGWGRGKTIAVAAFAGMGHVVLTSLLGLGIAWFGFRVDERYSHLFSILAGLVLIGIGLYYCWRQWKGTGICHHVVAGSDHHASEHCGEEKGRSHWEAELAGSRLVSGDRAAIGGLFLMITLSPCEAFLPVYLSAVQFGWNGFFVLSAILAVATLAGMTLFTWLTLIGFGRFQVKRFEKWEAGLIGALFCLLGLLLLFVRHDHGHEHDHDAHGHEHTWTAPACSAERAGDLVHVATEANRVAALG
jgi:ABC-type nickel/cobalt efflux system permease component RcnA